VRGTARTRRIGRGGERDPLAAASPIPGLVREALIIAAVLALGIFLVYHFTVHSVKNTRPLGGANVDVSRAPGFQSEAALAVDPRNPRALLAASNDSLIPPLRVETSTDGGRTWVRGEGPPIPGGSCAHGEPRAAIDGAGREYLAFLVGRICKDTVTPFLVVASRANATSPWTLVRVTAPAWQYGFDDGPAIATDPRTGAVYVAFTRSLSVNHATTEWSVSHDHGLTWSPPKAVSRTLERPHLASLAVAPDGDVYLAGIDATHGVWIARSTDGGRTFGEPASVSALLANPSGSCGMSAYSPLPLEDHACIGPNPTVVVRKGQVDVVYGDIGDVFVDALTPALRPLFHVQVNPADGGKATQFFPVAAADASNGTLTACWWDTTFDRRGHRAWFTCSSSPDGRAWSSPVRASADPIAPGDLSNAATTYGLYPALVAAGGTAHPVWPDLRVNANLLDLFTAAIPDAR